MQQKEQSICCIFALFTLKARLLPYERESSEIKAELQLLP